MKSLHELARQHPVVCMVALTYSWSWSFEFAAFWLFDDLPAVRLAAFFLGAFGPAVGGIVTLRLLSPASAPRSRSPVGFCVGAALALAAVVALAVDFFGVASMKEGGQWLLLLPEDTPPAAYLTFLLPVLVSGWVFSQPRSRSDLVRRYFRGLVPDRRAWVGLGPVLLFIPALLLSGRLIGGWLGLDVEASRAQQLPWTFWLPQMLVKLLTVAMLTGGNEEHGWRGVMLPLLQRTRSPLSAAVIVAVVWELWHLPVVLSGLYGDAPPLAIILGRLPLILLLTIFFVALYNGTRGSIFLCVVLHGCVNTQLEYFGVTTPVIPLTLIAAVSLVVARKMWRKDRGYVPAL